MALIIVIQGFHDKEFLQIFYRSLQVVCKLINHHNGFPDFQNFPSNSVMGKLDQKDFNKFDDSIQFGKNTIRACFELLLFIL